MAQVVESQPEDRDGQQDEVDGEAPQLVKDPDEHLIRDEHARLLQIRANLLQLLPGGRLVRIWMHKLAPLYIQRRLLTARLTPSLVYLWR